MSTRHDPVKVLKHLADNMDFEKTLKSFPGLTKERLAEILRSATFRGTEPIIKAVLFVDGASRGNPGQAGAGVVIDTGGGKVYRCGEYIGEATNNEAEYRALLLGMQRAEELGVEEMEIRSDSELMVKQMNGHYKVKSPQLQEFYFKAIKMISSFEKVTFGHVPRENNKEADRLANLAIDAKGPIKI